MYGRRKKKERLRPLSVRHKAEREYAPECRIGIHLSGHCERMPRYQPQVGAEKRMSVQGQTSTHSTRESAA